MVVLILGYCYDGDSGDGDGYILQERAKGKGLYDDALEKLAEDNRVIYEKCRAAMFANGITKGQLAEVSRKLKLSGVS